MRLDPFLDDPILSCLLGIIGLIVLWPIMACVAILIGLSSDRPLAILRRVPVDDHPLHTVYIFNTRCRIGEWLIRNSLHTLPVLLSLFLGEVTALDIRQMKDWRPRWRR